MRVSKIYRSLLWCFILLFSGCQHVKVNKEYISLEKEVKENTKFEALWTRQKENLNHELSEEEVEHLLKTGLSRMQAVTLVLQRNPTLQAKFEELGIAKADLVQAGLFTNPTLETLFDWPKDKTANQNTLVAVDFKVELADFWKVPIKRRIAKDELLIKTNDITQFILTLIAETKIAYDTATYSVDNWEITKIITQKMTELRDHVYSPTPGRVISDFDKNFSDVSVARWELEIVKQHIIVENAYTALRQLLNVNINADPIRQIDPLDFYFELKTAQGLIDEAFKYRPELKIAQIAISRAKHEKDFQKARFLDHFKLGADYVRGIEGGKLRGFGLGLETPLFDTRRVQVERAQYLIEKAKQDLTGTEINIRSEVSQIHQQLIGFEEAIGMYYENVIPSSRKAISLALKEFDTLQANVVVLVSATTNLYQAEKDLLDILFKRTRKVYELERAVGKKITTEKSSRHLESYKKIFDNE